MASLKYPADSIFKIQSVEHPNHYLHVEGGDSSHGAAVIFGPEVPGSKTSLWQYQPDTESIKNIASGTYIVFDEAKQAPIGSKTPQAWKVHENDDGTHHFQVSGKEVFAHYSAAGGAPQVSKASSKSGAKPFKIIIV